MIERQKHNPNDPPTQREHSHMFNHINIISFIFGSTDIGEKRNVIIFQVSTSCEQMNNNA
jgi:hypothetical protein